MNEFRNRVAGVIGASAGIEDAFSQIERGWGASELLVTRAVPVTRADEVADSILFPRSARSRPTNGQTLHVDCV